MSDHNCDQRCGDRSNNHGCRQCGEPIRDPGLCCECEEQRAERRKK